MVIKARTHLGASFEKNRFQIERSSQCAENTHPHNTTKLYKKQTTTKKAEVKHLPKKAAVHKKGTINLTNIIQTTKTNKNFHKAGAIALFIGVVRGETKNKEKVKKLELEAYEEKANETLENICNDLNKKEGITDVQIHHLLGEFKVGEELVYVLVTGTHRNKVFPTLQKAVERYKKEAPIFKKEYITNKKGKTKFYWVNEQEIQNK